MDYTFELQLDAPKTPEVDGAGAYAIEFVLGHILDYDRIIVMSVMLIPTDRQDVLELCFGIRSKEVKNDEILVSEPDYGKEAADIFVPHEYRHLVYRIIIQSVFNLVKAVMPDCIVMETFYPNLPFKAMRKYDAVIATVNNAGYMLVDEFRNDDGINYWAFDKLI